MIAETVALTAQDVAKGLSMFEIDEALDALVEAAQQEAEENGGEVSDEIKAALATYAEAFECKIDRIANYLKAQKAESEIAQREADRFQTRHKSAEGRERRLKQMLVWYMTTRNIKKLRGAMNTVCMQANSTPSLVIQDCSHIPDAFYTARMEISWPEWREIVSSIPEGPLRDRLEGSIGKLIQKDLQRGVLSDALARGEKVEGVTLVKGDHIRLR